MKFFTKLIFALLLLSCNNSEIKTFADTTIANTNVDSSNSEQALRQQIAEEAKPAYIDAWTKITKIRQYINLADSGKLQKKDAVYLYNSTVGSTMGKLTSFSAVKNRIDTAGDAYVDYIYKKAQADIALQHAAEKSYETDTSK